MKIIDTHVHYNMDPLFENWRHHWEKAQAHGVEKSIVVGTTLETSQRAVAIAHQEPNLYAAVGIHPNYTSTDLSSFEELLSQPKVIAIGETGLDYFRVTDEKEKKIQQQAFRTHVKLAKNYHKLVIIHVRDQATPEEPTPGNAYWDALAILKENNEPRPSTSTTANVSLAEHCYRNADQLITQYASAEKSEPLTFILHCVSGPLSYLDEAISLGGYIGVAGNVTYKSADRIREIVKRVPVNRLLLETDAPFLPPVPYRGQACEPWMISETASALAESGSPLAVR